MTEQQQSSTGCRYDHEGHGPCGGQSNGLYCQNHQQERWSASCPTCNPQER